MGGEGDAPAVTRRRVLFVCTHNSARSQMAEGLLRALGGDRFDVASAGTQARGVNQLAVRVMTEAGVDLARHTSKTLDRFLGERWDHVITVCDGANEACPVFPGAASRLHWSFDDPSADRVATFETEPRTSEQIAGQFADKGDRYPTIVVEREGVVVGWASAGTYRSRPAYAGVAEHSVYVARAARGRGVGRVALDALCRAYAARGFWKLVSRIFPENRPSLALHARCGFRTVGVYARHGKRDGEWRDCVIVEKLLDDT